MDDEKPLQGKFVTGGHLLSSSSSAVAHSAGCPCCLPSEEEEEDAAAFQSGNVLWIILVAVALLAALTIVLSRGGSGTNQTGDVEQYKVKASQVMRYASGIEAAVQQMVMRGVSESDISFENSVTATDYTNANCASTDCRLFDVSGGAGLSYRNFAGVNGGADWIFTGANNVGTTAGPVGTTVAGTGNDLVMLLPGVEQGLCIQINRDLGVGTAGTLPVETTGISTAAFTGTYATGGPSVLDGDPTPFEMDGKTAGCFIDANNANTVYFYYVVLAR